jgi:hypothetical protein
MPDSQAATYTFRVRILGGFYAPPAHGGSGVSWN